MITNAYNWRLILASESGHKITANHKMGDASVYNKWWKQPDKYKVFGITIHEIEEAMDLCDNKPFEQSEEKFSRLEELLKVSLNVFEVTLLPGYDYYSKNKNEHFASSQIYSGHKSTSVLSLCILNDTTDTTHHPQTLMYNKDLTDFKQRIYLQNDAKNRNLSRNKKCRFCDFFGSQRAAHAHEVQVHRDQIDYRDQYELE